MTDFWTQILDFAQTTTERVGTQLLQDYGQAQASEKSDGSLVTKSDQWADQELRNAIAQTFPTHGVLSEETEHIFPAQDWCWVIDPLDGTTNFARGLPLWGISLGLLYQGTPVFGYVHFPPLRQSFHGFWQGSSGLTMPTGAFLNHNPIHASPDPLTSNHFFNLCARSISVLKNPVPAKIRMLGVTTYSFLTVAAGATLGGVEATPKIWDIAAVWAIVQAAGAVWYPLEPNPIFPIQVGQNYSQRSFPTLVVSRSDLLPVFEPLVSSIGSR
ncbi:MAG: inositol monophosphatase family protein [Candidatus Parcubacteria bacterium]|uniref:inositol monophosphatase family protein n=1 Tax=Phormidesmis priestleyi TaxID=268141 RepID=UPI00083A91E6|nr:inositol monophosphatase family protein [Phormidesmis priestleyi]MBC7824774.1 inositol monophosphatase family protein [Leptolyngbyaceae cyanobacterium LF-bin-113]